MIHETYANGRLVERDDPTARAVTTWDGKGTPTTRPYTPQQNAAADQAVAADALLTDLQARVERIEAHLWPPAPPTPPGETPTAPTWAVYGGVWPAGGLLADGGTVWRNVSGVPLTTPPSGFPQPATQWGHLFTAEVTAPPAGPQPWKQPGGAQDAYPKDALVTHKGATWKATVGNNVWEPGVYGWVKQ